MSNEDKKVSKGQVVAAWIGAISGLVLSLACCNCLWGLFNAGTGGR